MRKFKVWLLFKLLVSLRCGLKRCGNRTYYTFRHNNYNISVRCIKQNGDINLSREELYSLKGLIEQQQGRTDWIIPEYEGDIQKRLAGELPI
jgi:hypothetical protein